MWACVLLWVLVPEEIAPCSTPESGALAIVHAAQADQSNPAAQTRSVRRALRIARSKNFICRMRLQYLPGYNSCGKGVGHTDGRPQKGWLWLDGIDMEFLNRRPQLTGVGISLLPGKERDQAMPDEQPSEFAAKIVAAYLRRNPLPADQLPILILTVHQALAGLGAPTAEPAVERTPAVSIRRSVHRDHVVCLDCGWHGQMLRRHLGTAHGLTVDAYRGRWRLPHDHAMTAPAYSERRSALAKQIGLGQPRGDAVEPMTAPETEPAAAPPRRRGRPRSAPAT